MLKAFALLSLLIAVAGCAVGKPYVISGNKDYVVVYDPNGSSGWVLDVAANHCYRYGGLAQFETNGGNSNFCMGENFYSCHTYSCTK